MSTTVLYAETRPPGVTRWEFIAQWRRHGSFALNLPAFRESLVRYVHRDPILDLDGFPDADRGYDALGELTWPDTDAMHRMRATEGLMDQILADGTGVVARTRSIQIEVEDNYLRDDYTPTYSVAILLQSHARGAAVSDRAAEIQHRLGDAVGPVRELARRIGVSPAIDPTSDWGTYLDLSFDTLADARAAYNAWWPRFRSELGDAVQGSVVLVTARCAMYDPGSLEANPAGPGA